MTLNMRGAARRLTAGACSVALVAGLVPAAAFGAEGLKPASTGAVAAANAEALAQRAAAIDSRGDAFDNDSIIVVYREGAAPSKRAASGLATQSVSIAGIPDASAEVISQDAGTPGGGAALRVDVPSGVSVGQAVTAAEADPDVVLAQPNFVYYPVSDAAGETTEGVAAEGEPAGIDLNPTAGTAAEKSGYPLPDDPYVGVSENDTSQYPSNPNQWWVHSVNAPQAWALAHGSDNPVAVAVLDTGINFEHEDLAANILADYAYDAYSSTKLTDSIDNSEMAHGSHVAGIVAAEANNGKGIAGVSYNAKVLPIRVFHLAYNAAYGYDSAQCTDEDLIRAYDYLLSDADGNGKTVAQETNTRVVNMSLGGYLQDAVAAGEDPEQAYDYLFEDKIEQAEAAGILTVAAAGNGDDYGNGRTDASYPSDYPAVMSVVALKTTDERTQWSDHNAMKNIAAPGNNIYSTYWESSADYHFASGTSMASPLVAGCAALLWAYDPSLTVRDVKDALYETADDLGAQGFDEYYGWGRVNLGAAVSSLGTVSIAAANTTMTRTETQQLSASERQGGQAQHAWKWETSDPSIATVSESGLLTARSAGKVAVTATAADDSSVTGRRTLTVEELAVPGAVTASANPAQNTISLNWPAANAARWYTVQRATAAAGSTSEPGTFADLGTFEAASLAQGESVTFNDTTARPSELYWYRVVPVGLLDGARVNGLAETSNRCFYTDKAALKASLNEAEDLLATTKTSADGRDVAANEQWAPASARAALSLVLSDAYGAYMSGAMLQVRVDAAASALESAIETFKAQRKPGLVKVPNTLKAQAVGATHSTTYGMKLVVAPANLYQVADAQGAVGYQAQSAPAGIAVAADGTLTVGASVAAGSYAVKVDVTAAGTDAYLPATQQVTLNVQVVKAANTFAATAKTASATFNAAKASTIAPAKLYVVSGAKGAVTYAKVSGDAKLKVAKNGTVTVSKGMPAGTYELKVKATAAGDANFAAKSATVSVAVTVKKAANPLAVKAKAPSVKYNKKKAVSVSRAKAFSITKAQGTLSFKKVSGSKALSINAKTGAVTVKKAAKKGTYSAKVKVTAAGTKNYARGSKTVQVKLKVK